MVIETPHGTLLRSERARNFGILFLNGSTLRMQAAADVTKQPIKSACAKEDLGRWLHVELRRALLVMTIISPRADSSLRIFAAQNARNLRRLAAVCFAKAMT